MHFHANKIFIPNKGQRINRKAIEAFLKNFEIENNQRLFTQDELLLLQDALLGKYTDKKKRPFFLYHFLPLWEKSCKVLFKDKPNPKIIELGCGTGTSSLLFSFLGAEVIGIELDNTLFNVCNKRKKFYENIKQDIKVDFYNANTFDFPYSDHAPVDAFFSLFAFNLMKPCDVLLERIIPALKDGGKVVIIDGNNQNIYSKIIPSFRRPGVLSPKMMKDKFEKLDCGVSSLETNCAIPPFIFYHAPIIKNIAIKFEKILKGIKLHRYFGVSYMIIAEKN